MLQLVLMSGCSNDDLDVNELPDEQPVELEQGLPYVVPAMSEQTSRSVSPSLEETTIQNIVYLLFTATSEANLDIPNNWQCVGNYILPRLNLTGTSGKLEFKFPEELDKLAKYKVLVVANLSFYTTYQLKDWAARLQGTTLGEVNRSLRTVGMTDDNIKPGDMYSLRDITSGDDLLMTAQFDYQIGQAIPTLYFSRKNVILNISFGDIDKILLPKKLKVKNVPLTASLFASDIISTKVKGEYELSVPEDGIGIKLYLLPNTALETDRLSFDLVGNKLEDIPGYDDSDQTRTPQLSLSRRASSDETTLSYSLHTSVVESHAGSYFAPNEYVSCIFTPSLVNRSTILLTLGGWLTGETNGVYKLSADGTKGYYISADAVNFNYVDTNPMLSILEKPLTGEQQFEIFIGGHGILPNWTIVADEISEWLKIENSKNNSSVIITAQPNFEIDEDGAISSAPRAYEFKLRIGEVEFPIYVRQDAAPLYPSDVTLPSGITVAGKAFGATSYNFYNNLGPSIQPTFTGDTNAKGYYFNQGNKSGHPNGTGQGDSGFNAATTADSYDNLDQKVCKTPLGTDYRLPTIQELAFKVYPYIRSKHLRVGVNTTTVFYIASDTEICFLPLTGNYLGQTWSSVPGSGRFKLIPLLGWYGVDPKLKEKGGFRVHSSNHSYDFKIWVYSGIYLGPVSNAWHHFAEAANGIRDFMTYTYRCVKDNPQLSK